jgi:hypothetical protein
MAESLRGKVAVITRAGPGFEESTAELFAKADQAGPRETAILDERRQHNQRSWDSRCVRAETKTFKREEKPR